VIKYILTFIPVSCIWQLHPSQYCLQKLSHSKYFRLKFQTCRSVVGNPSPITGRMNYALSLAGRKIIQFHPKIQFDGICFSTVVLRVWTTIFKKTNNFLRATFSSVCSNHFAAHLKLFKQFLTIFWTTTTGWEMTSPLIRWPLLGPVIVRWQNNVSIQCSSRDCERLAGLCNVTVACPLLWFLCIVPGITYGFSSDNKPT